MHNFLNNPKQANAKILLIAISFVLIFIGWSSVAKAAGASLYLSPNSGTFYVGSTFDVSIFVNTGGEDINAVQTDLKFDSKKLQIASPTAGKSFISVWISQPTYSNIYGTAFFQGGIPSPGINTSAGLVSTITFRVIAPGETTVSFLDSSRVLLDDGKGTDVLTSVGRGVYILSIPPPEGPKVFSPTHSDQNKWYKNPNPSFSWEKEKGVTDFSYSLDFDSQGTPDNTPEGDFTSISFSDLEDGIWYFHIKAKKTGIWGGTSHYLVQLDSTFPASFTPEVEPSVRTSVAQPIISFITTDALSGFDHFEIKIIDISPSSQEDKEVAFFVEVVSPYKLPLLKPGQYMPVVRAFDKAGNWRDESIKIEIIPKGIGMTGRGIWFFFILIPWWLIIIILILIFILIIALLILWWKKYRQSEKAKKWEIKQGENDLKTLPVKKLSLEDEKIEIKIRKRVIEELIQDVLEEEKKVEREIEIINTKEKNTQVLGEKMKIEMERQEIEHKRQDIEKKRWAMEQERDNIINRIDQISKNQTHD